MALIRPIPVSEPTYIEESVEVSGNSGVTQTYTMSTISEIVGIKSISVVSPWTSITGRPSVAVSFTGNTLTYTPSGTATDQTSSFAGTIVVVGK